MSKILILTASPVRDLIVDTLLSEELTKLGHEVSIRPCLREGRAAIIECQPDVVVVPPIRNPYSRDLVETIKHFGMGIVSRHTEPSCDWRDFNKLPPEKKHEILGQYPYYVDAELVWSKDEMEILAKRPGAKFPVYSCGAFTADAYLRPKLIEAHRNKDKFCLKWKLDPKKKILLITSPWGFADSAPDLHIEPLDIAKKDTEGRDRHFEMVRYLIKKGIQKKWNVIVTVHPGVVQEPYKQLCAELKLPLDAETPSFELKVHADGIIHAGSTMAIGAHILGIPAWQFGDVNAKDSESWWGDPESDISKVSPHFTKPEELFKDIMKTKAATNANLDVIKSLEKGRFGIMDGKATVRAAGVISKIKGKFALRWPKSTRDYSQLTIRQTPRHVITQMHCAICKEEFVIVNESFMRQVTAHALAVLKPHLTEEVPEEVLPKIWNPPHNPACPYCSARFFLRAQPEG